MQLNICIIWIYVIKPENILFDENNKINRLLVFDIRIQILNILEHYHIQCIKEKNIILN